MTFQMLLMHPMVQALGWALLHFLWQGTLLAAVLFVANVLARRSAATLRYAIGCAIMLLMPVVFLATMASTGLAPAAAPALLSPAAKSTVPMRSAAVALETTNGVPPESPVTGLPGWAVCLWLAGVIALSAYTAGGWLRAQRLKRRGTEAPQAAWIEMTEGLRRRLEISRPVRLCASAIAEVPMVIGWLRPVILLPVTAITGLDESQLRAILAHELAHIRRHDYLFNLLQTAVETLLFYHPAVWWVGRQVRREREHCCDDLAIAVCGDVMVYAGALAQLEELRGSFRAPALAATGGDLLARIQRLMGQESHRDRISKSLGGIVAAAVVLCAMGAPMVRSLGAAPQSAAPQENAAPQDAVPRNVPVTETKGPGTKSQDSKNNDARQPGVAGGVGGGIPGGLTTRPGEGIGPGEGRGEGRNLGELLDAAAALESTSAALAEKRQALAQESAALAQEKDALAQVAKQRNERTLLRELQGGARAADVKAAAGQGTDLLLKLYDSTEDIETKRIVLGYLSGSDNPKASEKILSVARTDPNPVLRRAAIGYIAGLDMSFEKLVSLYDSSSDPEMKRAVLGYLGGSDDARAADKLFSIAQSDPSPELRHAAVGYLAGR